jgi:hypothetical protein
MFDEARHAADIRTRMARSAFAGLLDSNDDANVITLPAAGSSREERRSARERAALRWATGPELDLNAGERHQKGPRAARKHVRSRSFEWS